MLITNKTPVPPHRAEGHRRHDGAAVARSDGAGAHDLRRRAAAGKKLRFVAIEMVHGVGRQHADRRRRRTCGRRPATGNALRPERRAC